MPDAAGYNRRLRIQYGVSVTCWRDVEPRPVNASPTIERLARKNYKPHRRGPRRGTFHLARAQFSPSLSDGGRGSTAAFGRDNSGPTDEGRKDAAEGRKESVNDGPRARDLGLASVSSASLEGPAEAAS